MPRALPDPNQHEQLATGHNGVPACQKCGGQLGFAVAGGAVEWWRCVACGQFYTARRACAHSTIARMQCATCGRSSIAFSVTLRTLGNEVTAHFCSKACLTKGLADDGAPATGVDRNQPRRKER